MNDTAKKLIKIFYLVIQMENWENHINKFIKKNTKIWQTVFFSPIKPQLYLITQTFEFIIQTNALLHSVIIFESTD